MPAFSYPVTFASGKQGAIDSPVELSPDALQAQVADYDRQDQEQAQAANARAQADQQAGQLPSYGAGAIRDFVSPLARSIRGTGEILDSPSLIRFGNQAEQTTATALPANPTYTNDTFGKIVGSTAGLAGGVLPFAVPFIGPEVLGPASVVAQTYDSGLQEGLNAGLPLSTAQDYARTHVALQAPLQIAGGRVVRGLVGGESANVLPTLSNRLSTLGAGALEAGGIGSASQLASNLQAGSTGYNIDPNRGALDDVLSSGALMAGSAGLLGLPSTLLAGRGRATSSPTSEPTQTDSVSPPSAAPNPTAESTPPASAESIPAPPADLSGQADDSLTQNVLPDVPTQPSFLSPLANKSASDSASFLEGVTPTDSELTSQLYRQQEQAQATAAAADRQVNVLARIRAAAQAQAEKNAATLDAVNQASQTADQAEASAAPLTAQALRQNASETLAANTGSKPQFGEGLQQTSQDQTLLQRQDFQTATAPDLATAAEPSAQPAAQDVTPPASVAGSPLPIEPFRSPIAPEQTVEVAPPLDTVAPTPQASTETPSPVAAPTESSAPEVPTATETEPASREPATVDRSSPEPTQQQSQKQDIRDGEATPAEEERLYGQGGLLEQLNANQESRSLNSLQQLYGEQTPALQAGAVRLSAQRDALRQQIGDITGNPDYDAGDNRRYPRAPGRAERESTQARLLAEFEARNNPKPPTSLPSGEQAPRLDDRGLPITTIESDPAEAMRASPDVEASGDTVKELPPKEQTYGSRVNTDYFHLPQERSEYTRETSELAPHPNEADLLTQANTTLQRRRYEVENKVGGYEGRGGTNAVDRVLSAAYVKYLRNLREGTSGKDGFKSNEVGQVLNNVIRDFQKGASKRKTTVALDAPTADGGRTVGDSVPDDSPTPAETISHNDAVSRVRTVTEEFGKTLDTADKERLNNILERVAYGEAPHEMSADDIDLYDRFIEYAQPRYERAQTSATSTLARPETEPPTEAPSRTPTEDASPDEGGKGPSRGSDANARARESGQGRNEAAPGDRQPAEDLADGSVDQGRYSPPAEHGQRYLSPQQNEALNDALTEALPTLRRLGVGIEENAPASRGQAAAYNSLGKVALEINRENLAKNIAGLQSDEQKVAFIRHGITEEVTHLADIQIDRDAWNASGRKIDFDDFVTARKTDLLNGIYRDVEKANPRTRAMLQGALLDGWNLYHDQATENVVDANGAAERLAKKDVSFSFETPEELEKFLVAHPDQVTGYMMETLRQLVQLRETDPAITTEASYLSIYEELKAFVNRILEKLRAVAADPKAYSKVLADAINQIERVKNGEPLDFIPRIRADLPEVRPVDREVVRANAPEPAQPPLTLRQISDDYEARGIRNFVSEKGDTITLSKVVVPSDGRGQGEGTRFMQDLTRYADANGKTIALTPSTDFGASSVNRLKDFYRRFGFEDNKGRERDNSISESMVRRPRALEATRVNVPEAKLKSEPRDPDKAVHDFVETLTGIKPPATPREKIELPSAREKAKEAVEGAKTAGGRIIQAVKKIGDITPLTDKDVLLRRLSYNEQINDANARSIQESIERAVPDKKAREAIDVYRDLGGDKAKLQAAADNAKQASQKARYERALNLSPDELKVAGALDQLYKSIGQEAVERGHLTSLRENYANRYVNRPFLERLGLDPATGGGSGRFTKNFRAANERSFETIPDVEQSGRTLDSYDAAELAARYVHEYGKLKLTEQLFDDAKQAKASDGRPLVDVRSDPPELSPNATDAEFEAAKQATRHDYIPTGAQGVFGNLAFHPEATKNNGRSGDIRNIFKTGAISKALNGESSNLAVAGGKLALRGVRKAQNIVRSTLFDISPFHATTEGVHASGHGVNPFGGIEHLDTSNPAHREALAAGLQIVHKVGSEREFASDLRAGSDSLVRLVPGLNKLAEGLSNFVFEDYIPSLKLKVFQKALARNLDLAKADLASGKLTRQDVAATTADQVNDGLGHQSYTALARNPTTREIMSIVALAPDFLESRYKFAKGAVRGLAGGAGAREQLRTFAILFGAQFLATRIFNKLEDGDYHWDKPFSFVRGNRAYTLRSVPEDLLAAITDPAKFAAGRESPLVRTGIQLLTGRNYRGEKVTAADTLQEAATSGVPIGLKGLPGFDRLNVTQRNQVQSWWDRALNFAGLNAHRLNPEESLYALANKYKQSQGIKVDEGAYPTSPYTPFKNALVDGDLTTARKELESVAATGKTKPQILQAVQSSLLHPYTGSQKSDQQFLASLSPDDRARVRQAQAARVQLLGQARQLVASLPANPKPVLAGN